MATKIGINGFGRIGRQVLKAINERHANELEVAAVNALTDTKTYAHLLKYDSTYGYYPGTVEATEDSIVINGKEVKAISQRDPVKIPWKDFGIDIVIESTGLFTDATKAAAHLEGGAKKIVISAPAKNEDLILILGVNEYQYDPSKHRIVSNSSCTTNCIAPIVKVLHDNFGIEKGFMSTVHSYTNDQRILDRFHKDLRRARAAGSNIIPTSTGAATATTQVIPELQGRINGVAFRVPTPTVSIIDFVADLKREVTTAEEINHALQAAAEGPMKGILEVCDEPLVSMDFKGNPASSIVDGLSTMIVGGNMVKVLSWYDNEWGYSCRTADVAAYMAQKGF